MIKPIETIYNGYRFRSRLEARWAVFFDTLRVPYEYEKEGYDLNGDWYLPDFWLPNQQVWLEIKPEVPNAEEKIKLFKFHQLAPSPLWIVVGVTGTRTFDLDISQFRDGYSLLKFEGDSPESLDGGYDFCVCDNCYAFGFDWGWCGEGECPKCGIESLSGASIHINAAYNAARQARFEHGEKPKGSNTNMTRRTK